MQLENSRLLICTNYVAMKNLLVKAKNCDITINLISIKCCDVERFERQNYSVRE